MRSRHCGSTCGHRGANAHPGGSRTRLGGWPGIGTKAAAPGTVLGTHSSSARVYGWWAAVNTSVALARSTMRPAYIVSTRSATSAITPRSWVTSTMAVPWSCCSRASRSSSWACTVTSRAVVGSSAISSFGRRASAIASITRWRMPPENWCG